MVKICPKCNMKNSNSSNYCTNCSFSLSSAEIIKDNVFDSTADTHYNLEIKGGKYIKNVWRPFVYLGIFFAATSFFIGGLLFAGIAVMLGGIAIVRGEILGFIPIIIASIPVILMFVI